MKTAIILSGNIRTWDLCKSNFLETFKEFDYDLYIDTYRLRYDYHPAIKDRIGDSDDTYFTDLENIYRLFDDIPNTKIFNVEDNFILNLESYRKIFDDKFKHLNINCFGSIRKLYNIITEPSIHKYDLLIKTRMDLTYHSIDYLDFLNLKDRELIIDSGNIYPNDCILACNLNTMQLISDFMYNEFFTPICDDSPVDMPHRLLSNAIKYRGIKAIPKKIMKSVIRKGNIENFY